MFFYFLIWTLTKFGSFFVKMFTIPLIQQSWKENLNPHPNTQKHIYNYKGWIQYEI
jgi:hypothetical protein